MMKLKLSLGVYVVSRCEMPPHQKACWQGVAPEPGSVRNPDHDHASTALCSLQRHLPGHRAFILSTSTKQKQPSSLQRGAGQNPARASLSSVPILYPLAGFSPTGHQIRSFLHEQSCHPYTPCLHVVCPSRQPQRPPEEPLQQRAQARR